MCQLAQNFGAEQAFEETCCGTGDWWRGSRGNHGEPRGTMGNHGKHGEAWGRSTRHHVEAQPWKKWEISINELSISQQFSINLPTTNHQLTINQHQFSKRIYNWAFQRRQDHKLRRTECLVGVKMIWSWLQTHPTNCKRSILYTIYTMADSTPDFRTSSGLGRSSFMKRVSSAASQRSNLVPKVDHQRKPASFSVDIGRF